MERKKIAFFALACAVNAQCFARMPFPLLDHWENRKSQVAASDPLTTEEVVLRVVDGDTLIIRGREKGVRIASIDAPESANRKHPPQPYSGASKQRLQAILGGLPRKAELRCYEKDQFGRDVCDVLIGKSNIGLEMVIQGMAWANTANNGRYLRSPHYVAAQLQAKQQRLGLWREENVAIAPWVWRKECWKNGQCSR